MGLPLDLLWLTIPAYVVVQVVALMRSSGGSRMAAALPLFVMVPVFVYAAVGLVQESNLWPLLMLFASPVALLYVTVVAFLPRRSSTPKAVQRVHEYDHIQCNFGMVVACQVVCDAERFCFTVFDDTLNSVRLKFKKELA